MAKKWVNDNLSGALHFLTANFNDRSRTFLDDRYCAQFMRAVQELRESQPFKLIAYVLMPDHCHLIINPRDAQITDLTGALKGLSARYIIDAAPTDYFLVEGSVTNGPRTYQVWQQSFRSLPLWSDWVIWRKINYIHSNPVRARLCNSTADYKWSSYKAFYLNSTEPLPVDREWWWPGDVRKLSVEMGERRRIIEGKSGDG